MDKYCHLRMITKRVKRKVPEGWKTCKNRKLARECKKFLDERKDSMWVFLNQELDQSLKERAETMLEVAEMEQNLWRAYIDRGKMIPAPVKKRGRPDENYPINTRPSSNQEN